MYTHPRTSVHWRSTRVHSAPAKCHILAGDSESWSLARDGKFELWSAEIFRGTLPVVMFSTSELVDILETTIIRVHSDQIQQSGPLKGAVVISSPSVLMENQVKFPQHLWNDRRSWGLNWCNPHLQESPNLTLIQRDIIYIVDLSRNLHWSSELEVCIHHPVQTVNIIFSNQFGISVLPDTQTTWCLRWTVSLMSLVNQLTFLETSVMRLSQLYLVHLH